MSILDTLNPDQEALVLDAVEGVLDPSRRVALDRLLALHPGITNEIERLGRAKSAVASMPEFAFPPPDLAAAVFERLDADSAPLTLRRMDPPRRRLSLSPGRVRTVAAAAALVLTGGLTLSFLRTGGSVPKPTPGPIIADSVPDTRMPTDIEPLIADPVVASAAIEQRTIELAHANWSRTDRTEPTLAEAVGLLAENRLVIRALAPSTATATAGRDALAVGLGNESPAWHLVGPVSTTLAARFERPDKGALYAMDEESGTMLEIPSPHLFTVWSARIDQTESAVASLVHSLRGLGLLVRLESADEAVEPEPSLGDAVWWDRAPSTWQPSGAATVVIDALAR